MKRASLILAALVPLAVTANQDTMQSAEFDYEQLRGNWRVSEIIGSDVRSSDGRDIGEVKDVLLSSDGSIMQVLVEADEEVLRGGAAQQPTEERIGFEEETLDERARTDREGRVIDEEGMTVSERAPTEDPTATGGIADAELDATESGPAQDARVGTVAGAEVAEGDEQDDPTVRDNTNYMARDDIGRMAPEDTGETDEVETRQVGLAGEGTGNLIAIDWSNPQLDEDVIQLDVESASLAQMVSFSDEEEAAQQGQLRASELIGMEVNLSDEESFGEVEDILVNQEGDATALVLESWNFLTRDRYAVPVELQQVNMEEGTIDYQLSSSDVEAFGEFDIDEYVETS